jgi:hypothetical protein
VFGFRAEAQPDPDNAESSDDTGSAPDALDPAQNHPEEAAGSQGDQ